MPEKFNELLLKQDIIELYNSGITPDYGYLMNGRFEKDMIKTPYPLKTLSGNPITREASDMEYLFPVVSLEPKQAGTGDPSPENVRPISGYDSVTVTQSKDEAPVKQITLTLPETIYGGTVDAVTGVGEKTWEFVEFDGTEEWLTWGYNVENNVTGVYNYFNSSYPAGEYPSVSYSSILHYNDSAYKNRTGQRVTKGPNQFFIMSFPSSFFSGVTSTEGVVPYWKSYLAAQASAGTPVQVAYKLATPEPFQATGNQALTIQPGNHTMYTDGDNISLTRKARRLEV